MFADPWVDPLVDVSTLIYRYRSGSGQVASKTGGLVTLIVGH